MLRISRALQSDHHPPSFSSSSSSSNSCRLPCPKFLTGGGGKSIPPGCQGRKTVAAISPETAAISPEKKPEPSFFEKGMAIVDISSSRIAQVARLSLILFGPTRREAAKGFCTAHSEMLVERVDCHYYCYHSCCYFLMLPPESISSAFSSPLCLLQAGDRWMPILRTDRRCRIPDRLGPVLR